MKAAFACWIALASMLALQRMNVTPPPEPVTPGEPVTPPEPIPLVSIRPLDSTPGELSILVDVDRTIVFDPIAGGIHALRATDRAAIEAAVRALAAGMPRTVLVAAQTGSYHHPRTSYGALFAAVQAAHATGAARIVYADYYCASPSTLAALERGDVLPTLVTLRALAFGREASRSCAEWLLDRIDAFVDSRSRPAWRDWLGTHGLLPESAQLSSTQAAFDKVVARRRRERGRIGPSHFSWGPGEDRDLDVLGAVEPDVVPHAIEVIAARRLPVDLAANALARYFRRAETRAVAWAEVQRRARALHKVFADWPSALIDVTKTLCEPTSHAEVVAALGGFAERHDFDEALTTIDECVALRARVGDLTAALARVP